MRILSLLFLFVTSLTSAQVTQPVSATPASDNEIVMTLNGYCSEPPRLDDSCKTEISRAEFDQLSAALQPDLTFSQRLTIAYAYARNLRMAAIAEQRGIDKSAKFEQQMRYARLQLLAQDLNQTLQTEASQISDNDIAQYYRVHQDDFEEAELERIIVPHTGHTPEANSEAMAKLAIEVRARLYNGEASDQLQREVFTQSATPYTSVNTKIEKIRRNSLPPNQAQIMAMEAGQVSAVISDPDGAHFIYKMVEKRVPELAELKDEITKSISAQRYRDSTREFQGNTVFSDSYFNPPSNQAITGAQRARLAKRANDGVE